MASSMRAVTETTVFLDNFQNIDLYFQGYYYFRCRLFYEVEEANLRVFATPFCQYLTSDIELRSNNSEQRAQQSSGQFKRMTMMKTMMRPPSSFAGEQSPTNAAADAFSKTTGSFLKPNLTPSRIFKNNLSQYNENSQHLVRNKDNTSAESTQNKLILQQASSMESQQSSVIDAPQNNGPSLRQQHNIRRAETLQEDQCFHSRIFYIRQSDEKVDLGEVINFKSEFEANLDLAKLRDPYGALNSQESIFGNKKFYLEIKMCFKEAKQAEIESQNKLKLNMTLDEAKNDFQVVSTCKLLLRNSARSGAFHFYPVAFDTGYFSSLSISVNSILKEFKIKPTPLLQELQANRQIKQYEAIDDKQAISAYHDSIQNPNNSLAELINLGKSQNVSKVQIQALQAVYINTLSQVYRTTRALYIRLLKQMKPSAYLEVQGIQSNYNTGNMKGLIINEDLPEEIKIQDLYQVLVADAGTKPAFPLSSHRNQRLSQILLPTNNSSGLIQQKRMDSQTPQLMTNLTSKINSHRPSIASNSFAMGAIPKPTNPAYMSKPNQTESENSLDDGNRSMSDSNNCDAPLSPRGGDANLDDDSIDAEVKSYSDSESHKVQLDTDHHHHIPDAVTYERDKKNKAYAASRNASARAHLKENFQSGTAGLKDALKSVQDYERQHFISQNIHHTERITNSIIVHHNAKEDMQFGSPYQDSPQPQTKTLSKQKTPKLIMNAQKQTTIQMLSKKNSIGDSPSLDIGLMRSPPQRAKAITTQYRDAAQTMQKSKKKGNKLSSARKSQSKMEIMLGLSDSKKKSCFNLSEILCMTSKQKGRKTMKDKNKGQVMKATEDDCDFSCSEDEFDLEKDGQNSFTMSEHQQYEQMGNGLHKVDHMLEQKVLTGSSSAFNLAAFRSQSPSEAMERYTNRIARSRKQMMSHSKSELALSMASPRASEIDQKQAVKGVTTKKITSGRSPKGTNKTARAVGGNTNQRIQTSLMQQKSAAERSPTGSKRVKTERRHRDTCKNGSGTAKASRLKKLVRSPTSREITVKPTGKVFSPRSSKKQQLGNGPVPQTQLNKIMSQAVRRHHHLEGDGRIGPNVRAAVPSFSGATKELDTAIYNSTQISRMVQPMQSESPYLEADETLGITSGQESPDEPFIRQTINVNKRARQLSDMLDYHTQRGSSFIKEERKAGIPKVSTETHGKYIRKGGRNKPRTSLIQLQEKTYKDTGGISDTVITAASKKKVASYGQYSTQNQQKSSTKSQSLIGPQSKYHQQRNAGTSRHDLAIQDENIEEDANDTALITLDSMTQKIQQNLNYLGSNNPFIHEKVMKPGSRVKGGAFSQRNPADPQLVKIYQRPKDYFSTLSMSIKTSQQKARPTQQHQELSQSRLAHRSPSNQQRPKPAIFAKNSVMETVGTERLNLRDSPTMATAMELHQRQLDLSAMSNDVSCKNSRLMNLTGTAATSTSKHPLGKQKTIEGFFGTGFGAGSASHKSVKQAVNEGFIQNRLDKGFGTATAKVTARMTVQLAPQSIDIQKVNAAMELQLRDLSNQIFKVWHKISRVIYLDPSCMQRVLRLKYVKQVNRYYDQMVVEYRYEEDLEENEFDLTLQKLSIKDSSIRPPNAILDSWRAHQQSKEDEPPLAVNKALAGSALFPDNSPAEEGKINPGKRPPQFDDLGDTLAAGANRRKVNSIFEYEMRGHQARHGYKGGLQVATGDEMAERQPPQICEESSVYTPNSRKLNSNSIARPHKSRLDGYQKYGTMRGRLEQRGRDNSVSTLGGKPISPRQIERSLVLARDRRKECSRVRSSLPFHANKEGGKAPKDQNTRPNVQLTSLSSSSGSDDSGSPRNQFMLALKQPGKPKTKALTVGMKHRAHIKFKLPIQDMQPKAGQSVAKDFEPIIIEEVFYNGKRADGEVSEAMSSVTPEVIFERAKLKHAAGPSQANSFISIGQSTQMAGYPKLTQQNKRMIKQNEAPASMLAQKKGRAGRIDTDESCDFFSDNLSETATGPLPENAVQPLKQQANRRQYHLFVFVHGFQASSLDMRAFRNHLQVLLPKAMFLVSQANERDTDSRIEDLGLKLAQEVQEFIITYLSGFHSVNNQRVQVFLSKLTFIGHSLGGIIIREALKHLQSYRKHFHGYISLGSPHLSYMYNSTSIIDAGMWLIKKFKQSESLKQLSMSDKEDKRESYLYRLSQDGGLSSFKYVILVSSYQDSYAPHDSARIQMTSQVAAGSAAQQADSKGKIYLEMVENILGSMSCEKLYRLDVNFKIQDTSLASLIGRTAHILMIECRPFYLNLIYRYREVFCE